MIRVYVKEFVEICEYLQKNECKKTNLYFYAERDQLECLLERYNYERSKIKLQCWKALRWMDADDKHLTKLVYDGAAKKNKRVYAIRIAVYEALKAMKKQQ